MPTRSQLHGYQVRSVDFVHAHDRCSLWLDLGLGKTVVMLTALSDWLDACVARRVLVVAPLRVANSVWRQEAAKWEHTAHLDLAVATGSAKVRAAALDSGASIVVINRENVAWLVKTLKTRRSPWPFDTVVIDEASSFKSRTTHRWKAISAALPKIERIVLLTATPATNGLIDLWPQQYLVDEGGALGKTLTAYRNRWFAPDYMGWSWEPRKGAEAEIHAKLAPTTLSLAAEDWIEVPDLIDVDVWIPMPDALRKRYDAFRRDAVLELADGTEIEGTTAGVLAGKLLQFAGGGVYHGDAGEWAEIHDLKLDALAEVVETNPDEPLLVAYRYRSERARILARFPEAETIDAPDAIGRWNRGDVPMLVVHPASAGHGLNLQAGGSILVWFGLDWSLELYQQTIGRLHRQGQARPVRNVRLLLEDTFDARVLDVLASKDRTQDALLTAVRREVA